MRAKEDIHAMLELYAVTDRAWLAERAFAEVLTEALSVRGRDGHPCITALQLREKNASPDERERLALATQQACAQAGIPLMIDDDVELAARIGADGAHIGQDDLSCAAARAILGEQAIIGVTAKTLEQALAAEAAGADYLGVGAVFPTSTKADTWTIEHETLRDICARVSIPVVAIGGITAENVRQLAGTGVAGIAVVSAIFAAPDIAAAVRELGEAARDVVVSDGGSRGRRRNGGHA